MVRKSEAFTGFLFIGSVVAELAHRLSGCAEYLLLPVLTCSYVAMLGSFFIPGVVIMGFVVLGQTLCDVGRPSTCCRATSLRAGSRYVAEPKKDRLGSVPGGASQNVKLL